MWAGRNAEAVCMLILAGACLGFLRYNFYPARIFLGDTGSTFLGLIFAIIGLSTIDKVVTVTSLLLPILAVGVPLFDVVLAIWRRSTRKLLNPEAGGIMDGDQDHLHHRLLRQTKSRRRRRS
ncbi:MAG: MraY family glycosyltransferase [Victivallales bacterium]